MTNQSVPKNAQDTRKVRSSPGGKNSLAYWERRIFLPTYSVHGKQRIAQNYAVELQYQGRRVRWSLGATLTKSIAAERAKAIYFFLHAHGWDATIAKYRPETLPQADPTVGTFIAAVERTCTLRPKTLRGYLGALRKIVSDIAGLADCPSKHQSGAGNQAWLERIHAVKLSALSPAAVQEWKRSFLAKAGQDPVSQRSAKVSANTFLRSARSLFQPKIIKHLDLELPNPTPFSSVQYEPKANTKYRSTFDICQLVAAARSELAQADVEAYKVFLLAAFAGLRKREIDLLEWQAFHWEGGVISITPTQHFSAKSEDSYSDVAIDRELVEVFRGCVTRATSSFVIESPRVPRHECHYDYYRCREIFNRLTWWLRAHGVRTLKPLHTLRKEFGSIICASYGIHAASRALRHSAVAVTDQFYTDGRKRASIGLGHLLEPSKIVQFETGT